MRVISWQKSISYNGYTSLFVKEMKLYEHLSLQVLNQVLLGPPQSILCTLLLPTSRAGGASLSGHHAPLTLYSWATRELRGGREGPPGSGQHQCGSASGFHSGNRIHRDVATDWSHCACGWRPHLGNSSMGGPLRLLRKCYSHALLGVEGPFRVGSGLLGEAGVCHVAPPCSRPKFTLRSC